MTERPLLVIGNHNYSSWSLRAWLALRHAGIDFDVERIALDTPGANAAILAHNGAGTVPVLEIDGVTIWESLAICEYAAERAPALWPRDRAVRAVARAVASEMHAGFTALRAALPMNCRATGRRVALSAAVNDDLRRIQSLWGVCRSRYGQQGPWLFGDFSIADAMYAPVASRLVTYGIELDATSAAWVATVLGDRHVRDWYAAAAAETEIVIADEAGALPDTDAS